VREIALDVVRPDGSRVPVLLNAAVSEPGGDLRVGVMEARDRHRYEQDLLRATEAADVARGAAAALANTLQQTLIPPAPPRVPGLAISAVYRPAGDGTTVGGDFYDIFQIGAEHWYVVVGDVSGKGPVAATVTSFVRYTVRALAIDHPDPGELLHHLDRAMAAHRTDHYCTLVLAVLSRSEARWSVRLALAGHPPALVRHRDGRVAELGTFGSPVGLVEKPRFTTVHHDLGEETVTLYTDGVTEARGSDGLYGEARLHRLLGDLPGDPDVLAERVAQEALRYQGGVASDDIAIVAFAAEDPTPT
jgi:sigma-B regulation protein RsbU (phosphoserine phosphatase)